MKKIIIREPYITSKETKTRLSALIEGTDFTREFYFEVDKKYEKYLCFERSDAFVLGLLYFSMVNGYDMECIAPISERLFYQLTTIFIPTLVKNDPGLFHSIKIKSPTDHVPIKNIGAVGASVSGGIDSFYSIVRNTGLETNHYNVTHLLITNCFNIYYGEDDTRKRFDEICKPAEKIAKEFQLEIIKIYTNDHIFWYPHYMELFCLRYASLPYALQKLFSVYNYSTGYQYNEFSLFSDNKDTSHYDLFSVQMISNDNLTIYSSGGERSRIEKVDYIADNQVVQNNLQVCNISNSNCGKCEKCLRTQMELYACGKLNAFEKVFSLRNFKHIKNNALIRILKRRNTFDCEILEMMHRKKVKIPFFIMAIGNTRYLIHLIKVRLKKIKPIYNVYMDMRYKKHPEDIFNKIDKYNSDHEYAKSCDKDIL